MSSHKPKKNQSTSSSSTVTPLSVQQIGPTQMLSFDSPAEMQRYLAQNTHIKHAVSVLPSCVQKEYPSDELEEIRSKLEELSGYPGKKFAKVDKGDGLKLYLTLDSSERVQNLKAALNNTKALTATERTINGESTARVLELKAINSKTLNSVKKLAEYEMPSVTQVAAAGYKK